MKNTIKMIGRLAVYLVGLVVIGLGINISRLSALGIAPVSSTPAVLQDIFPKLTLGSTIMIVYFILILLQIIVLRKSFQPKNLLGIVVAVIFGWITDFVGIKTFTLQIAGWTVWDKEWDGLLMAFPKPANIGLQFVYLAASILIIGIGVFIYLRPNLVPMPAEGLAGAIAQKSGKAFGNCKTIVDVCLISLAVILQVATKGFGSLWIGKGTVGIGTICAAVLVGQVVKFLHRIFPKKG